MGSKKPNFPIIGIGASAGGIKALQEFFDHLPSDSGMAFVVVIHLDPEHSSSLDKLLESHSQMKALQVTGKTKLQPNHIYIIAPGKQLHVRGQYLLLSKKEKEEHATIDLFFRSLAKQCGEQAVGVILSGTGTDGTVGLKVIKEHGGVAIVQEPEEAEYDGMPLSAIHTNLVDFILPLKDIGPRLVNYKGNISSVDMSLEPGKLPEKESKALHKVFVRLNAKTGHDFSHYKRSSVLRRLQRRMQVTGNLSISEYHRFIQNNPDEVIELFKDLLISVTNFFRDPEAFGRLEEKVIHQLFEGKESGDEVRVWVVGCATGEEAYSVAILLHEYASRSENLPQIKIFATDISKEALQTARQGIYPETITADVSEERIQRFFDKEALFNKEEHGYRVRKEIREMVLFCFHDLLGNPPFSNLDLIACRNLLIYLNSDLQSEVFKLLHYALRPEAFLFLGLSDSTTGSGSSELFTSVDKKKGIFKSRPFSKSRLGLPQVPIWNNIYYGEKDSSEKSYKKTNVEFDKVHYTLLARQFAPASIIINDNNEVMHASAGIEQYLHYSEGEPSRNLFDMLTPELRRPLRGMLFQVEQKKKNQSLTTKTHLRDKGKVVQLTVQPIQEPDFPDGFSQVIFSELDPSKQADQRTGKAGDDGEQSIGDKEFVEQLEAELAQVKEQLNVTVEEYETSNEELRTSNEELQSMNEELQTTTEELETSKEELQSVNEELRIVNDELEDKVEELRQANNDLKNLMEATEVGIIFVDRNLHIKRFTNNVKGLFNLVESDIGRPLSDITNKLVHDGLIKDVKKMLDDLTPVRKLVSSKDDRWYMMRLRPYRTTCENIEGAVITFVEVTNLKEAEEALAYRARQQEATARLGLYALDMAELQPITDQAIKILADILQVDYVGLLKFDREENMLFMQSGSGWQEGIAGKLRLENGERWETGYTLQNKEPVIVEDFKQEDRFERSPLLSDHEVTSSVNVIVKEQKVVYGVLGVHTVGQRSFTDHEVNFLQTVTNLLREAIERVQAENELEETNRKLKEAVRLRDEFLSIASHELQTPVTSVKTQAELFERHLLDAGNDTYAEQVRKINERIDTLTNLINNLLDISRMQEGELKLEKEEFSLNELVEEATETLDYFSDHIIEVEGPAKQTSVYADRFRIGQVLTNLLENAIKYSLEADRVIVRYGEQEDKVVVSVVDFGVGISDGEKKRVFERFFKGSGEKQTYPGFGIGLYICAQIIQRHGGDIWVEDSDGQGSVFTFNLPKGDNENN